MRDALRRSFLRAFGIAVLAGLGALPTALLIVFSVVYGKKLDEALGTSPLFILGLTCVSVPVSILALYLIAWLAARAALRVNHEDNLLIASSATEVEEELLEK